MLGEVGGHLQRRVERHIQSQLVADGVTHLVAFVPADNLLHVGLEDAGGVVHRTALQAGKRQNGGVSRFDAAAELGAHGTFVADHVGPGAAQSRRAHCLMGIDHDVVLGRLHDGVVIVVDDGLAVVSLAVRQNMTHIAALHRIVAVLVHQVISPFHPSLVIDGG